MIHVTVWNEFRHEKSSAKVAAIYPNGMHETIASFLRAQPDMEVGTATLDEPEHGLTQEVLQKILNKAGSLCGLGDWRPSSRTPGQFGRFSATVEPLEEDDE